MKVFFSLIFVASLCFLSCTDTQSKQSFSIKTSKDNTANYSKVSTPEPSLVEVQQEIKRDESIDEKEILLKPEDLNNKVSELLPAKQDSQLEVTVAQPIEKNGLSHDNWNALLQKHVSTNGKVNYKGFKADIAKLDAYLSSISQNPVQSKWSKSEQMAYWINAYNAFTVKLIVDSYPLKSITDLHEGKPWDVSWIKIGDKSYSLNNIENDILRPKYKEARIHFAVNCAARSCPPLLNRAWTGETLERYFSKQAKAFINSSKYNNIGVEEITISKIFEWYAGDFGDIVTYLNQYSNTKIKPGAKVKYMEYDWALNE